MTIETIIEKINTIIDNYERSFQLDGNIDYGVQENRIDLRIVLNCHYQENDKIRRALIGSCRNMMRTLPVHCICSVKFYFNMPDKTIRLGSCNNYES